MHVQVVVEVDDADGDALEDVVSAATHGRRDRGTSLGVGRQGTLSVLMEQRTPTRRQLNANRLVEGTESGRLVQPTHRRAHEGTLAMDDVMP